MRKTVQGYAMLVGMAGFIIIVDQLTKALVRADIPFGQAWSPWPWLAPFARIVNWNNTGAAFGFFQGSNGILAALAIVVSLVIIYYYPRIPSNDWVLRVALGLQLGGALGNLIDRFSQGRVTDFLSVGSFAVFNVADSCITVGVIVLILGIWYKERKEKQLSASTDAIAGDIHQVDGRPPQSEGDHLE